jgi:hypothetical protein
MRMHDLVESTTADEPPLRHSVDDIVAAGQRLRRRRRAGWATASVTALAVTATAAVPSLVHHHQAKAGKATAAATVSVPAAATSAPAPVAWSFPAQRFTFTFRAFEAGRLHVQDPRVVTTAYQIAAIHADGMRPENSTGALPSPDPSLFAYLIVYRPGAYRPTGTPNATIAGRPAIEADVRQTPSHRFLAWQYANGAWATIYSYSTDDNFPSAKDLRDVAAALRAAPPAAAKLPFTMTYVPPGFRPFSVGSHVMAGLDGIAADGEGDFGGALFAKPAPAPTGLTQVWNEVGGDGVPGSFEIFIVPNSNSNQALKPGEQPPTQPRCGHGICNGWSADGKVNIQVAREGNSISDAEMAKVVSGIRLAASLDDDAGWPDAPAAIPVTP